MEHFSCFMFVLSRLCCRQQKSEVNKIQCHSLDGSPKRPKSLEELEKENTQGRYNRREVTMVTHS